jgi:hypothetical protein
LGRVLQTFFRFPDFFSAREEYKRETAQHKASKVIKRNSGGGEKVLFKLQKQQLSLQLTFS